MLDDKKRAETEQSIAAIRETLPAMWWGMYQGCIDQGFSTEQAMSLVEMQILSGGTNLSIFPQPPAGED